jgi:hypothetical protein
MEDRSEYWNPKSLGYRFLAEAKRLWEVELIQPKCLTTLQAAVIINVVLNSDSMDKLGLLYSVQAIAIAEELDIFGPLTNVKSERGRQSYCFTAWALYFWTGYALHECQEPLTNNRRVQCYYFMIPPLIRFPPETALPHPDQDSDRYPELWLQYPDGQALVPTQFGHFFAAKNRLMTIINRISFKFFKKDSSNSNPKSSTVVRFITELQKWYSVLPHCLGASEVVFPSQLKLQ